MLKTTLKTIAALTVAVFAVQGIQANEVKVERISGAKQRNVIFILTDDHRYDAMGFMGHPFLETPNMDFLAKNGVHLKNAFVTTALCSPSRASILTGLYPHKHKIVDNNTPIPPGTVYFSQFLQKAGYQTGFFGKWHMGHETDDPQPGWDRWVSFKGQGTYLPSKNGLNVDGQRVPQKGYITDELTDYALDWLNGRKKDKPFMMYLSHKAVHADFVPAERHKGRYAKAKWDPPKTMPNTPENYEGKPMWLKNQRNSWHGVDYPYHTALDVEKYYKDYCEALLAVDEGIGRILDQLRKENMLDSTLIIYMGDNGFLFGEHGLIDKRVAYEESMRVPMLMHCPELFKGGTVVEKMVVNIDVAPTIFEAAGVKKPAYMDGASFIAVSQGKEVPWRDFYVYTYYWERNFPQTPTLHCLREDHYKFVRYYGLWDLDELYDIRKDPKETKNLINHPDYTQVAERMRGKLFAELEKIDGLTIPLYPDKGRSNNLRLKSGSEAADFPEVFLREK